MRPISLLVSALLIAVFAFGLSTVAGAKSIVSGSPAAVDHPAGQSHTAVPKRVEEIIEIDLREFAFASPDGRMNPAFTVPVGKTVGIHLHNEGALKHEMLVGRQVARNQDGAVDGYETSLFEAVVADAFFYYGEAKAELGGAHFEEVELEPGIKDVWLRVQFPAELAGEWEIGCFVPGHYDAGMHATLIVQ